MLDSQLRKCGHRNHVSRGIKRFPRQAESFTGEKNPSVDTAVNNRERYTLVPEEGIGFEMQQQVGKD